MCSVLQRKIADYLNSKTVLLSKGQLKICLIIFCIMFSAASVLAVIDSFNNKKIEKPAAIKITKAIHEDENIDNAALKRIHRFRLYMDSVSKNDRSKYDSIIHARPHLMDSIIQIEKLNKINNN